jgi:hypothetical protein
LVIEITETLVGNFFRQKTSESGQLKITTKVLIGHS